MNTIKYIFTILYFIVQFSFAQNVDSITNLHEQFEKAVQTDFELANSIALEAVKKSELLQDDSLLLQSYFNLSTIHSIQKKNDSASKYANKALELASRLDNFEMQAFLYNRFGSLTQREGSYTKAITNYKKALRITEEHSLLHQRSTIYNGLAWLYKEKRNKKKAFEEIEKAITIAKKHNFKTELIRSYNVKGVLFFNTSKKEIAHAKDSAMRYYEKALSLSNQIKHKHLQGVVLSNLGDIYLNIGKYELAFECLTKARATALQVHDYSTLHYVEVSLGIYYEEVDNFPEAVRIYQKSLKEYGQYISDAQKLRVYWLLPGAYSHNKQYKEAFEYQEKYTELTKDLFNIKKSKEFDEIRTIYEVEKKDARITLLAKENELAATRRNWIIISSIILAIPLIILIFFYRHRVKTQRTIRAQEAQLHLKEKERLQKEQEVKQIQALIDGQDNERNRIAKELHDGIGGQLAGMNLRLTQINSEINNSEIKGVNQSLANTFKELRILSHNLSANYFRDKDIISLLLDLKQQYEGNDSFITEISVFPEKNALLLDSEVKHHLYRIVQELLSNAAKHAQAHTVEVSINIHDDELILMYEDDGTGFDATIAHKGIGFQNMKERVTIINGNITFDTQLDKGTRVVIEIPMSK
ncbi:tetratricopeptide repeat protein [uncultured Kordia sp.]|uniref:tetratricopeptide repeat protein n=1 Tax=uncultured Kordia sp. TaxID=507699 RepID=UPI002635555A|nr:tetratricopeptide repeat protein [uncultured Kordia sp.]